MKQFLYLDTDIVNSIVAQSQKGLVTQTTVEKEDNTTKNSRNTENIFCYRFWQYRWFLEIC